MKTSELKGSKLDWAVAKCEGFVPFTDGVSWIVDDKGTYKQIPKYSTDWAQGGPIIERELIAVWFSKGDWKAQLRDTSNKQHGSTPLIAAMRCYVASKLGNEVEIPEEMEADHA